MACPKLYFFELSDTGVTARTTFRDLNDVFAHWQSEKRDSTGLLHCGFTRPKLIPDSALSDTLKGKVLYTESLRTLLPEEFPCLGKPSLVVRLDDTFSPCYLASEGWGYGLKESMDYFLDLSLSKSRKAPNFVHHSSDPDLVENCKPSGWVEPLRNENEAIYKSLENVAIYDEASFLVNRNNIPAGVIAEVDWARFQYLAKTVDKTEPQAILAIAPLWVSQLPITDLELPVRPLNSLRAAGIENISQLQCMTASELLELPNMGTGSVQKICHCVDATVAKLLERNTRIPQVDNSLRPYSPDESHQGNSVTENYIRSVPLVQHVQALLNKLATRERKILVERLGYSGQVMTLEEIGTELGVTRERVRQIAKKIIEQTSERELWIKVIESKIGELFADRTRPLAIEMLDIEDPWFAGFDGKAIFLRRIIEEFCGEAFSVVADSGRHYLLRCSVGDWEETQRILKKMLKIKAKEKRWTRSDVRLLISSQLAKASLDEFAELMERQLTEFLKYDGQDELSFLVDYGKSAEQAVSAALFQASAPMHYEEIAKAASLIHGKEVATRLAHHAAARHPDVFLFDRGTYGLIDHCPLSAADREIVCLAVVELMYKGEINRQWHSREIIRLIDVGLPNQSSDLNPYVLRMCIESSPEISFLNRMIWARSDSGLVSGDRIETAQSFIEILETAGKPLTGKELKRRLSKIRGVSQSMQIHPSDRLISVGPNTWGLSDWTSQD